MAEEATSNKGKKLKQGDAHSRGKEKKQIPKALKGN